MAFAYHPLAATILTAILAMGTLVHSQPSAPDARPSAGVRLWLGLGRTVLPDYTILASSQVRNTAGATVVDTGVWCQSALNSTGIGLWYYPGGMAFSLVPENESHALPFYARPSVGQVGLSLEATIQGYSGYYHCQIPDEDNTTKSLYVAIYSDSLLVDYPGPLVSSSVMFSLASSRDAATPIFDLSFNVSFGPPTTLMCRMDGTELNITDVAREVIRPLYNGTGEPDLTLVTVSIAGRQAGLYNCTVASIGFDNSTNQTTQIGSAFVSTFIDVAQAPAVTTVSRTDLSNVLVQWSTTQSSSTLSYEVFYEPVGSPADRLSLTTTDQQVTLPQLSPLLDYSLFVVAYMSNGSSLPSVPSNTATIPSVIDVNVSSTGYLIEGSTDFSLLCSYSIDLQLDTLLVNTTWLDNNNDTVSSSVSNATSSGLVARFSSLEPSNAGFYQCLVTVLNTSSNETILLVSRQFNLTVQLLNTPTVSLVSLPSGGPLVTGQNSSLVCNVTIPSGTAAGMWSVTAVLTVNDSTILTSSQFNAAIGNSDTYHLVTQDFNPLRASHGGEYTCSILASVFSVNVTTNSSLAVIIMLPAPVVAIATNPPDATLFQGTYIDLQCTVNIPEDYVDVPVNYAIQWEMPDGTPITTGAEYNITSDLQSSSLRINLLSVDRDNGTSYRCSVNLDSTNPFTSQSNTVTNKTLQVQYVGVDDIGLSILLSPSPTAGTSVTFTCSLTEPLRLSFLLQPLTFFWFRNNLESIHLSPSSNPSDNKVFEGPTRDGDVVTATLSFVPLRSSDADRYYCRVFFPGSIFLFPNASVSLSLAIPSPYVSLEISPVNSLYVGSSLLIVCTARLDANTDTPVFVQQTWTGPAGQELTNTSDILVSSVSNTGPNVYTSSVAISSLQESDSGIYHCNTSVLSTSQLIEGTSAISSIMISVTGPPSPPRNFTVTAKTSTSLELSWLEPETPNGAITSYTLTINNGTISTVVVVGTMARITGLTPYQQINATVYVTTVAGDSPVVSLSTFTSPEKAGAVASMSVAVLNDSSVTVYWEAVPDELSNGVIQFYRLVVMKYGGLEIINGNRTFQESSEFNVTQTGLEIETAYTAVVFAVNNAPENGVSRNVTFFTLEGIPPEPTGVSSARLNATHMRVAWNSIPLDMSRGFITSYAVTYTPVSGQKRQVNSLTVSGKENTAIIGELVPTQRYSVMVAAITTAGTGSFSRPVISELAESSEIQLLLKLPLCATRDLPGVQSVILSEVVRAINDDCNCAFTEEFITGELFLCTALPSSSDTTQQFFSMNISLQSFGRFESNELVAIVQTWARRQPAFIFNINCLISVDSGQCSPPLEPVQPTPSLIIVVTAPLISILVLAIVLVLLFMIVYVVWIRRRKRTRYLVENPTVLPNPSIEPDYQIPLKEIPTVYPSKFTANPSEFHVYENPNAHRDSVTSEYEVPRKTEPLYRNSVISNTSGYDVPRKSTP